MYLLNWETRFFKKIRLTQGLRHYRGCDIVDLFYTVLQREVLWRPMKILIVHTLEYNKGCRQTIWHNDEHGKRRRKTYQKRSKERVHN